MQISVELSAWLKRYADGKSTMIVELPEGSRVKDLIEKLSIPVEEVGFAIVNDERKDFDYVIVPGDKISLYQYILAG